MDQTFRPFQVTPEPQTICVHRDIPDFGHVLVEDRLLLAEVINFYCHTLKSDRLKAGTVVNFSMPGHF